MRIPYELNEPALLAAQVDRAVASFGGGEVVAGVPKPQGGVYEVLTFTRDDVGNEERYMHRLGLDPIEGRVRKIAGGFRRRSTGRVARPERGAHRDGEDGSIA